MVFFVKIEVFDLVLILDFFNCDFFYVMIVIGGEV